MNYEIVIPAVLFGLLFGWLVRKSRKDKKARENAPPVPGDSHIPPRPPRPPEQER